MTIELNYAKNYSSIETIKIKLLIIAIIPFDYPDSTKQLRSTWRHVYYPNADTKYRASRQETSMTSV